MNQKTRMVTNIPTKVFRLEGATSFALNKVRTLKMPKPSSLNAAQKTASSPVELVLIALCACTASDVVGILRKKREPFTALEVRAVGTRADTFPKIFTHIRLTYRVSGNVTHKAMEDAVRLSKEKYCSVSAMLEKAARIEFEIEYV